MTERDEERAEITAGEYGRILRAATSRQKGDDGEERARTRLHEIGFRQIVKNRGKWIVKRWIERPSKSASGGRYGRGKAEVVADPDQRNFGDWSAIWPPDGRSVRIEVKAYDERLQFSKIKEWQRAGLEEHARHGGIALLVWVNGFDVFVMSWPIAGFVHGSSLKPEEAAARHAATVTGLDLVSFNVAQFKQWQIDQLREGLTTALTTPPIANLHVAPGGTIRTDVTPNACGTCGGALTREPYGENVLIVCEKCGTAEHEQGRP